MRGKIFGIILCVLGIAGLITSLIYVSVIGNPAHAGMLLAGGIFSATAFFMGLRMMPGAGRIAGKTLNINMAVPEKPVERRM